MSGPSAPPPGVQHSIAVAGGRGGVGTSSVATNVAVYLAQLGRKVLLVDANPTGAALHTLLDLPFPETQLDENETRINEFAPIATPIPGLSLLPQLYSASTTAPLRPGRKPRWLKDLRLYAADYVVMDLGSGTAAGTLDLFRAADLGLNVCQPDPLSIEGTYRFLRALFQRQLRRTLLKDRYRLRLIERAQAQLSALPPPQELVRGLSRFDTGLAQMAAGELAKLRPRLILNGARSRADTEVGLALQDMAERYLGVKMDYVGHIEQDESVRLSASRRRPLLLDSPTSKSARNIERICRRVLALVQRPVNQETDASPIPLITPEATLYDVLLTHRGAPDDELRRAYKRQREIYKEGSLPLTSLLKAEDLPNARAQIDEAHDTLLDPLRRRAYDISTFPDTEIEPQHYSPARDAAIEAEREMMREELARELTQDTEYTGGLLKRIRMSHGIEVKDVAAHTKISALYLTAIEDEDFGNLPAFVYLRGFVTEIAKFLKLDVMQVTRTYLKRYRRYRDSLT